MTTSDTPNEPVPTADTAAAPVPVTRLERLAGKLGSRASATAVYGEPVTSGGVTVIPVAEISYGFAGGAGREAGAAGTGEGGGGGGFSARPRGFIEIKDGTTTYKSLRAPWVDVVVPLAALLAGAAVPRLVRRLAARRSR
ncbi:spore germination protein GerW family protein [Streptomyces blastmyceticus]|uniref:Sporulation protein n=1 Tax=Streptomyces blastmyceticus TaxID=68180 RepID=A0ABP3GN74_9ACTN